LKTSKGHSLNLRGASKQRQDIMLSLILGTGLKKGDIEKLLKEDATLSRKSLKETEPKLAKPITFISHMYIGIYTNRKFLSFDGLELYFNQDQIKKVFSIMTNTLQFKS
jgi:hypothetical protein